MRAAPDRKAIFAVVAIVMVLAAVYTVKRRRLNSEFDRLHPLTTTAREMNAAPQREWCDDQVAARRAYVAAVMDRFRSNIVNLWRHREQKPGTEVPTISIGPIRLRVSAGEKAEHKIEFEESAWSWEDAYGGIQKTQHDLLNENELQEAWRDVDAMATFLLQKDYARIFYGRKFLPPELTRQQFRPNPAVERTGRKEFSVLADAGEFAGHEKELENLIEREWRGNGYRVRLRWVKNNPVAYRFEPNMESGRSFVNHRRKAIVLENLAWTKTVAHEFGHVLGFEDHYYVVWDSTHCYYKQLARNGDLMSNSKDGRIGPQHWEILEQAYPLEKKASAPFGYVFKASSNDGK